MLMLLSKSSSRDTCLFLIFYLIEILNAQLLILSMGNNIEIGKRDTQTSNLVLIGLQFSRAEIDFLRKYWSPMEPIDYLL